MYNREKGTVESTLSSINSNPAPAFPLLVRSYQVGYLCMVRVPLQDAAVPQSHPYTGMLLVRLAASALQKYTWAHTW